MNSMLLVIDELSFIFKSTLNRLERYPRIHTGRMDDLFGGIKVFFAGYFSQIPPFYGKSEALQHMVDVYTVIP